jgi:hypothetical protein
MEKFNPGGVLTFPYLISLVDEIANIMKMSIGVDGKAVLISIKSPRQITITKVNQKHK